MVSFFMPSLHALVAAVLMANVAHAVDLFSPNWVIPDNIGQPYPTMAASVGDTLTFAWAFGTHDVWIHPSGSCDQTGRTSVGSSSPSAYTFTEGDAGRTLTFTCDIGSHCQAGMLMDVTVSEATADETAAPMEDEVEEPMATEDEVAEEPMATEDELVEEPDGEATQGPNSACYICGDAETQVTNPDFTVSLPDPNNPAATFGDVSCSVLYEDGLNGIIPEESCAFISQLASVPCGCTSSNFTCNICGDDDIVRAPDAEIILPSQGGPGASTTCAAFAARGENGELTPVQCDSAPIFAYVPCQCAPANFTCSICGEGFKVSNPDDVIDTTEDGTTTCGDLETQGLGGLLSPFQCTDAERIARTTGTCACIPEEGYPECPICGDITVMPMSPDNTLTLAFGEIATCASWNERGMAGELSPGQCNAAQAQSELGCNCAPEAFTCNVCGGNGTGITMLYPELNFTVPAAGVLVNCGELDAAGLEGVITPNDCSIISPLVQEQCGCAPTGFTCNICGDDSGLSVTNGNSTFVPQETTTCAEAEVAALAGEVDPLVCGVYQSFAGLSCGCAAPTDATNAPTTGAISGTTAPVATPNDAPVPAPVATPVAAPVAPAGVPEAPVAAPAGAPVAPVPGSVDGATGSTSQESTSASSTLSTVCGAVLGMLVALLL